MYEKLNKVVMPKRYDRFFSKYLKYHLRDVTVFSKNDVKIC